MWALAWNEGDDAVNFVELLDQPRLGCVVVMQRSGGGHVTLFEGWDGSKIKCRGGNQSDAINVQSYKTDGVIAYLWPKAGGPIPPVPPAERRELEKGDTGSDVVALQKSLGIPADGDFGSITETQVKAFQAASGLVADGVVGPQTWEQVDALDAKIAAGSDGLSEDLQTQIIDLAQDSAIADFSWPDRGRSPPGYIPGMALAFGLAMTWFNDDDASAVVMAQADRGDSDTDALTWYRDEFAELGMDNNADGIDTLRHLFALMIGLGMRESSGKYCEGRDMSASNVTADTAEAGLFQTSWDIRSASPQLPKLLTFYWADPNGFLDAFNDGISPSANNLQVYGSGDGARYQFLAKYSPAFAAMITAVGLRTRRQHWGPINRREVDLMSEADDMLQQVQELVAGGVAPEPPEPEPPPAELPTITVSINPPGSAQVVILGAASERPA
jgi:hypothetical protein